MNQFSLTILPIIILFRFQITIKIAHFKPTIRIKINPTSQITIPSIFKTPTCAKIATQNQNSKIMISVGSIVVNNIFQIIPIRIPLLNNKISPKNQIIKINPTSQITIPRILKTPTCASIATRNQNTQIMNSVVRNVPKNTLKEMKILKKIAPLFLKKYRNSFLGLYH